MLVKCKRVVRKSKKKCNFGKLRIREKREEKNSVQKDIKMCKSEEIFD